MNLKVIFANSVDPDQTAPLGQFDQGPQCLTVCKNRLEKFARIFSRRHKQTTFSDAGFLGILRVKYVTAVHLSFTVTRSFANQNSLTITIFKQEHLIVISPCCIQLATLPENGKQP